MAIAGKVVQLLRVSSLDALVAHSYINVSYLSRANIFTQKLIPDRLALILWPAESAPVFIVCSIEEVAARRDSLISDVRTYVEHKESPIRALGEVIRERKLEKKRIGFEEKTLSARHYKELLMELPEASWVGCDRALVEMRMVKEEDEIHLVKSALLKTDAAIIAMCEGLKPGMTERELARVLRDHLYEEGADEVSHLILSAGENARDVHHLPGNSRVKSGDLMHIDVGGKFGHYFSDLGRMTVVGTPSGEQRKNYELVWEAVQRLIDGTRLGMRAKDVYALYQRTAVQQNLFDERLCPHVGHGLGMELHEHPILEPLNEQELRPGMVLAMEVAHHSVEGHVYHTEDIVHVTDQGCEVLSRSRDWKQLLIAG